MSTGAVKVQEKGLAVLLAMAGFVLCIVTSAILLAGLLGPLNFRWLSIRNIVAVTSPQPARAQHGVAGAAERDARGRPAVPGWDPVIELPATDLASLNPDQAVDRALGYTPGLDPMSPRSAAPAPAMPVVVQPSHEILPAPSHQILPAPSHQTLPAPPNAPPASVFAIEMAFFLDSETASRYAAALDRIGVASRLVEQRDEAGRTWIYVRTPAFDDSTAALAYADTLERQYGLPALLVSEPPAAAGPAPAPAPIPAAAPGK